MLACMVWSSVFCVDIMATVFSSIRAAVSQLYLLMLLLCICDISRRWAYQAKAHQSLINLHMFPSTDCVLIFAGILCTKVQAAWKTFKRFFKLWLHRVKWKKQRPSSLLFRWGVLLLWRRIELGAVNRPQMAFLCAKERCRPLKCQHAQRVGSRG